jgi:hypothetical protein
MSTLRFCSFDKDSIYVKALSDSVSFRILEGLLILSDSFGRSTLTCTPSSVPPITPDLIQLPLGRYRTSLTFNINILV